jgi:hypothetical protein
MTSLVIWMLAGKRLQLRQWMTKYEPKIGMTGSNSAPTHTVTHTSLTRPKQYNSNSSLPLLQGSGEVTMVKEIQSKLKPPKPPSVTWLKPLCWLDTQTLNDPTAHTS